MNLKGRNDRRWQLRMKGGKVNECNGENEKHWSRSEDG